MFVCVSYDFENIKRRAFRMRTDCVLFGTRAELLCGYNLDTCQSSNLKGHLYCKLKVVITRSKQLPFCCFEHGQVDCVVDGSDDGEPHSTGGANFAVRVTV